MPTDAAFAYPMRTLPKFALVICLHALALFLITSGDRIMRSKTPQTAVLLAFVPPQAVEPPPPPPPQPRRHQSKAPPQAREAAAPQRDVEAVPRTEVVPTIVDNAIPVEPAGGKPQGTGTAGAGDVGEGAGSGAPVKVRAVLNPDNCERPRLPWAAEQRRLAGDVILAVLINVDGKVTDARVAHSSGQPILDETALKSARACHFVAATVDKVPVPSWEAFRFSWVNH